MGVSRFMKAGTFCVVILSAIFGCSYSETNLNYCSNINGDLFCIAAHEDKIYCLLGTDVCVEQLGEVSENFDGCVVEQPPGDCYSPCGGGRSKEGDDHCALTEFTSGSSGGAGASTETNESHSASGQDPICGNGILEEDEVCDGTDLSGESCVTLGFDIGELSCRDDCSYDDSRCTSFDCGNSEIEGIEICDGLNLGGIGCESLGYSGGVLACRDNCVSYDTVNCCGDGVMGMREECDGVDIGGETCASVDPRYSGDGLRCRDDCVLDVSGCCGDGEIGAEELCDGSVPADLSCLSLGFLGGVLNCTDDCELDTHACFHSECGNGSLEPGELCDGDELGMASCEMLGLHSGTLVCNDDCAGFNAEGCAICGNGLREGDEECDGIDLGGETCTTVDPTQGGALACLPGCEYDTAGCESFGGDCCDENGTPGCEDILCTMDVCSIDPFCCTDAWSWDCVFFAEKVCVLGMGWCYPA